MSVKEGAWDFDFDDSKPLGIKFMDGYTWKHRRILGTAVGSGFVRTVCTRNWQTAQHLLVNPQKLLWPWSLPGKCPVDQRPRVPSWLCMWINPILGHGPDYAMEMGSRAVRLPKGTLSSLMLPSLGRWKIPFPWARPLRGSGCDLCVKCKISS